MTSEILRNSNWERNVFGAQEDQEVPELSDRARYDPFPTDVFIIVNFIMKEFVKVFNATSFVSQKCNNLDFVIPLLESMLERDPRLRPTSDEAEEMFERIVSEQPPLALRWRLKTRESDPITHFFRDMTR